MDDTNTPAPRKRRRTDPELTVTRDAKGRFLKGSRANPYGRPLKPKRDFTWNQLLKDEMPIFDRMRTVIRDGKEITLSTRELLLEATIEEALRTRKPQLLKMLADRDGKNVEMRTAYIAQVRQKVEGELSGVQSIRDLDGDDLDAVKNLLCELYEAEFRPGMHDVQG